VGYAELLARLDGVRALGVDLGLARMRQALSRLGDPQRRLTAVQIAGTNGKGSTAAMAEAVLAAAGLRTGLYTSPHLSRFSERIRISGRESEGERLAEIDRRVAATEVPLTYFEVATALAFVLMAEERVEAAVLETGLGGRLDAVTTAEPIATAIVSIAMDHTDYLGGSLIEIAREKAGILKPGVPCFLGRLPAEADEEVARVAAEVNAPLLRLGRDFPVPAAAVPLAGAHQRDNAAIAIQLAKTLTAHLGRPLDDETIARGLANTRWPGRFERVGEDLLFDCAHNADGAHALAAALTTVEPRRRIVLLVSIVRDKDACAILAPLAPLATNLVTTRSDNPRSRSAEELAAVASDLFDPVTAISDPVAALAHARTIAAPDALVVVCGSTFLVGLLRAYVLGEAADPVRTADPV
jgi:dihydrofolate synthase / folylpolyglutamate synthase